MKNYSGRRAWASTKARHKFVSPQETSASRFVVSSQPGVATLAAAPFSARTVARPPPVGRTNFRESDSLEKVIISRMWASAAGFDLVFRITGQMILLNE